MLVYSVALLEYKILDPCSYLFVAFIIFRLKYMHNTMAYDTSHLLDSRYMVLARYLPQSMEKETSPAMT
jgi:hypothetical protein